MKQIMLGSILTKRKVIILGLTIIVLESLLVLSGNGDNIWFVAGLAVLMLAAWIPVCVKDAWIFKEDEVVIVSDLRFMEIYKYFFNMIRNRTTSFLTIPYDKIRYVKLIYRVVDNAGPSNPMGDCFLLKLFSGDKEFIFDLRLEPECNKIIDIVELLKVRGVQIIDEKNVVYNLKHGHNLYVVNR